LSEKKKRGHGKNGRRFRNILYVGGRTRGVKMSRRGGWERGGPSISSCAKRRLWGTNKSLRTRAKLGLIRFWGGGGFWKRVLCQLIPGKSCLLTEMFAKSNSRVFYRGATKIEELAKQNALR